MAGVEHKLPGEYDIDGMKMSCCFPRTVLDRIRTVKLYDDDVIITCYPKSGTTWMQEIIWLVCNNADVARASQLPQDDRVPFIEIDKGMGKLDIDIIEEMEHPRIIKSHLPYRFFRETVKGTATKVIVGMRNIKDILVSLYFFYQMNAGFGNFKGTFNEFFVLFKEKRLAYGDWFDYNLEYWNNRHEFNLYVLKYEDIQKDILGTIRKLAVYLEKDLTEQQVVAIAKHVSFDAMKNNTQVNKISHPGFDHSISPFFRKGKVGDWKSYLTVEQNEYIDNIYSQRVAGSGLDVDFEITPSN